MSSARESSIRWLALVLAAGCTTSTSPRPAQPTGAESRPEAGETEAGRRASDPSAPPAQTGPWWTRSEIRCDDGAEAGRRSLSWGTLYWCPEPGGAPVDRSLQNDLGRIARCIRDAADALQSLPVANRLPEFIARAEEVGLSPDLCQAVRRDPGSPAATTYHGREVYVHVMPRSARPDGDRLLGEKISLRFSCPDCLVVAETSVVVAQSP